MKKNEIKLLEITLEKIRGIKKQKQLKEEQKQIKSIEKQIDEI